MRRGAFLFTGINGRLPRFIETLKVVHQGGRADRSPLQVWVERNPTL